MKKIAWMLLVALGASACQAAPTVSVTPRYTVMELEGEMAVFDLGAGGPSDLQALGLEDADAFAPRLDLSWLSFDAWVTGFATDISGQGVAQGTIDLGGPIIPVDEPVDSSMELDLVAGALTFDMIPGSKADFGLGVGVGRIGLDTTITSLNTPALSINSSEGLTLPLVAARLALEFGSVEVSAIVAALKVSTGDSDLQVVDADLMGRWHMIDTGSSQAGLVVGYRMTQLSGEYDSGDGQIDADLQLAGLYLGVTFQL